MVDLSEREESGVFLEGTGSVVFDHVARAAYACLSPRTDERTFREVVRSDSNNGLNFTVYRKII